MSLRQDMMKELKTARDLVYQKERELSEYAATLAEQQKADTAYIAMMSGIDLDEGGDDDE